MKTTSSFETRLRARLLDRVRESHARESQFLTVRRDADTWLETAVGVRERELARTTVAVSSLIELAAGAALPVAAGVGRIELVVLAGEALLGSMLLSRDDAASAPNDAQHGLRASDGGARLCLWTTVGHAATQAWRWPNAPALAPRLARPLA